MSADDCIIDFPRAVNAPAFEHRFTNPSGLSEPSDSLAMIDNVDQALDHACATAKMLYAGAFRVDEDLTAEDFKNAALALANQIQDAKALLQAWYEAGGHHK